MPAARGTSSRESLRNTNDLRFEQLLRRRRSKSCFENRRIPLNIVKSQEPSMCGEVFYRFGNLADTVFPVGLGQMRSKGHCTYLNTILNDTVRLTGRILAVIIRRYRGCGHRRLSEDPAIQIHRARSRFPESKMLVSFQPDLPLPYLIPLRADAGRSGSAMPGLRRGVASKPECSTQYSFSAKPRVPL